MPEVMMVDDVGEVRPVQPHEVNSALAAGWSLESPEQAKAREQSMRYGTLGQQLVGTGEAALRGATLGISDVALTEAMGDDYREGARARKEELGSLGTVAEIGGAIAPIVATGGTGALARGTALLGAPVRGSAAVSGLVGRGAVGALGRAGIAGESILGRAAVKGVQYGVEGAIEGGLYGAGTALTEAALAPGGDYDRIGEKVLAGSKHGALFGAAAGGLLGTTVGAVSGVIEKGAQRGLAGSTVKEGLEDLSADAAVRAIDPSKKIAREIELTKGTREFGDVLLERDIVKAGRSTEDMLTRAQAVKGEAADSLETVMQRLDADLVTVNGSALRKRVDDVVAEHSKSLLASQKAVGDRLRRELGDLLTAADAGEVSFSFLQQERARIDDLINWSRLEAPSAQKGLKAIRGAMEYEILEGVKRAGGDDLMGLYKTAKRDYGVAATTERQLRDNLARGQSNRFISLTDTIAAGAGVAAGISSGGIGAVAGGLALGSLNKAIREKGAGVVADYARRIAKSEMKLNGAVKKFFKKGADIRRGALGEGGASEAKQQSRIARTLAQKAGESSGDAYRRKLKQIQAASPDKMPGLERAATEAPQLTTAVLAGMQRGKDFLLSEAPRAPFSDDPLQPHVVKNDPNPEELDKWLRKVEIVEDPLGTIERGLANNTLMREHVRTLEAVWPATYEDIRHRIWDQVQEEKARIPYEQRIRLGVLFRLPTDKSLRPDNIRRSQAIYATQPEQPQTAPVGQSTDIASKFATGAQSVEGGFGEF